MHRSQQPAHTDDVVAELENSSQECILLEGNDFYDLRRCQFNKFYRSLKERFRATTRAKEDEIYSALVAWCEILRDHGVAPQAMARAAAVAAAAWLKSLGGTASHRASLVESLDEAPTRKHLEVLFAKAIVDLCFLRGYITD
jgi:hypothetical protein